MTVDAEIVGLTLREADMAIGVVLEGGNGAGPGFGIKGASGRRGVGLGLEQSGGTSTVTLDEMIARREVGHGLELRGVRGVALGFV